LPDSSKTIT